MGCDIHIVVETKITYSGRIENPPVKWYCEMQAEQRVWRNYDLFAKLAGVRNYRRVVPIAMPRGIPEDAAKETKEIMNDVDYHSHSWISEEFRQNWPWQPNLETVSDWHMLGWYYLVAYRGMAQTRFIFAFNL